LSHIILHYDQVKHADIYSSVEVNDKSLNYICT